MRRYGPLIVVPGALAVGDPGRHHLRLTPEALLLRSGAESRGIIDWSTVDAIVLDVPTTRFRLPGLVSTLLIGALTLVTLDSLDLDPEDGTAHLTIDRTETSSPLSRHHVGGYWAPTVRGAQRLLQHLIDHPEQRQLLAHPDKVLDVAVRLARG